MKHTQAWQHCPRCDFTEVQGAYTVDDAGARSAFSWGFLVGGVLTLIINLGSSFLASLIAGLVR